jgi:hypothetical protein
MKKQLYATMALLFCVIGATLFAQVALTPNPQQFGQCPGVKTYTVSGLGNNCGNFNVVLIAGSATITNVNVQNKTFTISVVDIPQNVFVRVEPDTSDADCEDQREFTIPVRSIFGQVPLITGCTSPVIGKSVSFNLTAELKYQFKGSSDPAEVASYEWEFMSGGTGWNMTTISQGGVGNKVAQIVTDIQNDATIRVRGVGHCGLKSEWTTCGIVRFVKPPCPIGNAPPYVVCENTDLLALTATVDPTLTGYTYHWTYPSGWTGNATGPAGIVSPNGMNGGTVTLVAKAFGRTSTPCTVPIPLEPIVPATRAIGPEFLCDDEPGLYTIDILPPSSSQITWSVSPSTATHPSSGTGMSPLLNASDDYNGNATITFTINTLCGPAIRSDTFFVGRPKINDVKIDGILRTFAYVCPIGGGSHWISVDLQGDADNCVDIWDDFGTTATSFKACEEFDFTFQYNPANYPPYNCVFVNAIVSNDCEINTQNIVVCPSYAACQREEYEFVISPNPANSTVNVSLWFDPDGVGEQVDFDFLEVIDNRGNVLQNHQAPGLDAQFDASNLREGLYYVRTWIEAGYVMGQLLIERGVFKIVCHATPLRTQRIDN